MSWSDYVQQYLVNMTDPNTGRTALGVCDRGAIVSIADGTVWAATPGFALETYAATIEDINGSVLTVEVNEFQNLQDAFENQGITRRPGGIRINREKYQSVSFDSDRGLLYLRKPNGGACVARSSLAFVIGTFSGSEKMKSFDGEDMPQNFGMMNWACENLQAFLLQNNL